MTLQRVALQTKMQLCEDEGWVPDVRAAVQELMTTLFASVYNHQDEEGRCYTDSMAELLEHDDVDGKKWFEILFFTLKLKKFDFSNKIWQFFAYKLKIVDLLKQKIKILIL